MFDSLKRLFYGIIEIDNVEFINKLKPNHFVNFINLFKSLFRKIYYFISAKQRFFIKMSTQKVLVPEKVY